MMTLDQKIHRLLPEIGRIKDELERAHKTLRDAGNHQGVLGALNQMALVLFDDIFAAIGEDRPSDNLNSCIERAEKLRLLPPEYISSLHHVRVWSNKRSHDKLASGEVKPELVESLLVQFLAVVEWFKTSSDHNPDRLESIYWVPAPAKPAASVKKTAKPAPAPPPPPRPPEPLKMTVDAPVAAVAAPKPLPPAMKAAPEPRIAIPPDRRGKGLRDDGTPDIDWATIPGGEFVYQGKKGTKIDTFFMSKYPVTNAQFNAFLNSKDGYSNGKWWVGLDVKAHERPASPGNWNEPDHPRETVNWFEAMAFCEWLSDKEGYRISLPIEQQWERAAAGTRERTYPWGGGFEATRANTSEGGLNRTSAVGSYPSGASEEGVMDLSGNVWEWCLNEYEKPERRQKGGREHRALRGGSWISFSGFARASARYYNLPHNRRNYVGFRVVSSSPIVR